MFFQKSLLFRITLLAYSFVFIGLAGCDKKPSASSGSEILSGVLALEAGASAKKLQEIQFPERPVQASHRREKIVKLENGLEALLIEDSKAAKTGIGVDVAAGSLSNPKDHKGLAHYVEHLLFLGSAKFPTAGEYNVFVQQAGGWSNAYTADTNTNYQLEINTSAIEEGLDRLSQFFIAPTFEQSLMGTELKNVDSEYQKNRQSTGWRFNYLRQVLADPHHPLQNLFQGDSDSLKNTSRQVAIDFYNRYYTADLMKVSIISAEKLERQEELLRRFFSSVKKGSQGPDKISTQVISPQETPRFVKFGTTEPKHNLTLYYTLLPTFHQTAASPTYFLSRLLNFTGPGSLVAKLKDAGLIVSLSAAADELSYTTFYEINVELTDKGLEKYEDVVRAIYSHLGKLRKVGLSEVFYRDVATAVDISYFYGNVALGADGASKFAKEMNSHGSAERLEEKLYRITKYDNELFKEVVEQLKPTNLSIFLGLKDFQGEIKTERYDFSYTKVSLKGSDLVSALEQIFNYETDSQGYSIPEKNKFVPSVVSPKANTSEKLNLIMKNSLGFLWHSQGSFPGVKGEFLVKVPMALTAFDGKSILVRELFMELLERDLEEWSALARLAGMNISASINHTGLTIFLSGYENQLLSTARALSSRIRSFQVDATRLALATENVQKDSVVRIQGTMAYERAIGIYRHLIESGGIDPTLKIELLRGIKMDDIRAFQKNMTFQRGATAFAYGNITPKLAAQMFNTILKDLGVSTSSSKGSIEGQEVKLAPGESVSMHAQTESHNSAIILSYRLGNKSPEEIAAFRIANAFYESAFYEEMRTKRTLGYIAQGWVTNTAHGLRLNFLVQSAKGPNELREIILPWIESSADDFDKLSNEQIDTIKATALENLRKAPESAEAQRDKFKEQIFENNGDLTLDKKIEAALIKVQKADVVKLLKKALASEQTSRLSVYASSKEDQFKSVESETFITDILKFQMQKDQEARPSLPKTRGPK